MSSAGDVIEPVINNVIPIHFINHRQPFLQVKVIKKPPELDAIVCLSGTDKFCNAKPYLPFNNATSPAADVAGKLWHIMQ